MGESNETLSLRKNTISKPPQRIERWWRRRFFYGTINIWEEEEDYNMDVVEQKSSNDQGLGTNF